MPIPIFDLSKPGAKAIPSSMGGGWIVPLNDEGLEALISFYGEPPTPLAPLGGAQGYIVEPDQSYALSEHLRAEGVAWTVGSQD